LGGPQRCSQPLPAQDGCAECSGNALEIQGQHQKNAIGDFESPQLHNYYSIQHDIYTVRIALISSIQGILYPKVQALRVGSALLYDIAF
jgi:hypothetical protein